ncbi:GatB/YqeY domain-containing protein [Bartonella doshiae]|uniref:GatB/YqeY domain-containing protein n=1 Tax=Bartonella doshiae TaxID=33044 RepID=UPI000A9E70F7|nr:GatB/YqeY domain-containing protein [Bartonella doshiae]
MFQQREALVKIYKEIGRLKLAEKTYTEMSIMREFFPSQLNEMEIEHVLYEALAQIKAARLRDMGKVMVWLKECYAGQMNFSEVCNNLCEKLNKSF